MLDVVVAPPALYLLLVREALRPEIQVAAQNVFDKPNGAFTGEISVSQLRDSNIGWTIVGHSERRTILKETDEMVASKAKYATSDGVNVIWCCGESLEQREAGKTIEVVSRQLEALKAELSDWSRVVIAYEPIWAIGTGKVATTDQAQEVHKAIRNWLKGVSDKVADETRIIYGGSVNDKNCNELSRQPDIDGFLVGGASLKPECECWPGKVKEPLRWKLTMGQSCKLSTAGRSRTGFRDTLLGAQNGSGRRGNQGSWLCCFDLFV